MTEAEFERATAIGESWATELVRSLRRERRDIVGEWPGTLGEARVHIRMAFRKRLDLQLLEALARAANLAARRGWLAVRVRDPVVIAGGELGERLDPAACVPDLPLPVRG